MAWNRSGDIPNGLRGALSVALGEGGWRTAVAAARVQLTDHSVVDAELADASGVVAAAEADEVDLARELARPLPPPASHAGFHGAAVDPRALAILGTLDRARVAGLYTPSDLAAALETSRIDETFRARECLRFRCFALLVPALIRESNTAAVFLAAVAEASAGLGNIEIAR